MGECDWEKLERVLSEDCFAACRYINSHPRTAEEQCLANRLRRAGELIRRRVSETCAPCGGLLEGVADA